MGDNLPILGNSIRAYAKDRAEFTLNTGEDRVEICQLSLHSASDTIHYDDFLFLAVNNTVVASSSTAFTSLLPTSGGRYTWDFSVLMNQSFNLNMNVPYCLGGSECTFPPTDQAGAIKVDIGSNALQGFAADLTSGPLVFETITTGDDDLDDCHHSSINLEMKIVYAPSFGIDSPLD